MRAVRDRSVPWVATRAQAYWSAAPGQVVRVLTGVGRHYDGLGPDGCGRGPLGDSQGRQRTHAKHGQDKEAAKCRQRDFPPTTIGDHRSIGLV